MSAQILSGKIFASEFKEEAKKQVLALKEQYNITPGLAVIIVGENPASKVYVNNKHRTCEEVGIYSEVISMPADTTKEQLIAKIDELNYRQEIHGILVQLPLPEAIAKEEADILNAICPLKDVDGFHPVNVGKLMIGQDDGMIPCTPYGCLKMLQSAKINIDGAQEICRSADILVAAVGRPHFITADMIKPGATVIDVGINRIAPKKLVGDVDFDNAVEVAGAITPVPGGVGLLTIAMLMQNTINAAKLQLAK